MIVAVASGKGGVGKTTIASALAEAGEAAVHLVDCDVEEPNCHILNGTEGGLKRDIHSSVPEIDEKLCRLCGACAEFCKFNALGVSGKRVLVFKELCHSCGGCRMVCPVGAVKEREFTIGFTETAESGDRRFSRGVLRVGNAMAPPVIRSAKELVDNRGELTLLDCSPGTSCPAVEGIRGADYVILVSEPTPFGLNDLKLAVEMVRGLKYEMGVIVNRSGRRDQDINRYCREEGIPVLLRIPESRKVAEAYSEGRGLLAAKPEMSEAFRGVLNYISGRVNRSEQ